MASLPLMTEVHQGSMAADRLLLTSPPGGQKAQHRTSAPYHDTASTHYMELGIKKQVKFHVSDSELHLRRFEIDEIPCSE